MLTRHGWLVLGGAALLLLLGRLLGLAELYVFGASGLVLVAFAAFYVGFKRLDLEVERAVRPRRVHAGHPSRVELRVRNLRLVTTPVLRLQDPVSGTGGAELIVSPLSPQAVAVATYRLPTDRRGILQIGPLSVVLGDPFGLTQAKVVAAPQAQVTVYPSVTDIDPAPVTTARDPRVGVPRRQALGRGGEDFYALRPYAVGDDLRRVHWPSTARHDELLVRQYDQPRDGRSTVLLDVGPAGYDREAFERAVSAAASILMANGSHGQLVRLVTTDGRVTPFGTGDRHLEALLERLAGVRPVPAARLRTSASTLVPGGDGALAVVLGRATTDELTAVGQLRARFGLVTVVEAAGDDTGAATGPFGVPIVRAGAGAGFAEAWNGTVVRQAAGPTLAAAAGGTR